MSTRKIKVIIDPMGNAKIDAIGFQGQGCTDATKVITDAIMGGAGDCESVMKPEWHEVEDETHVNEISQRW